MNAIVIPHAAVVDLPPLPPTHPTHRFTFDDVMRMQEVGILDRDHRCELLDGELVEMPEEGELHVWIKNTVSQAIYDRVAKRYTVLTDSTLKLSDKSAPDPDIYVAEDVTPRSLIRPDQVRLAIEVADSSIALDLGCKAALYARHAVPEYWVIDVDREVTHVLSRPGQGVYSEVRVVLFDDVLHASRVEALDLRLADLPGLRAFGA